MAVILQEGTARDFLEASTGPQEIATVLGSPPCIIKPPWANYAQGLRIEFRTEVPEIAGFLTIHTVTFFQKRHDLYLIIL